MIPQLVSRKFGYGSGMLAPNNNHFIINIPKNASSMIVDLALHNDYTSAVWDETADNTDCDWTVTKNIVVVVRDPIKRWIAGVCQYLNSFILSNMGPNGPYYENDPEAWTDITRYVSAIEFINNYNEITERLIFDNACWLDDHVWPQHYFYENILPSAGRLFYNLDKDNFLETLAKDLNLKLKNNLDLNRGSDNSEIATLQAFFKERINSRPDLRRRLRYMYQKDFYIYERSPYRNK